MARMSEFFSGREPSSIRMAQMLFEKRREEEAAKGLEPTQVVNTAIGNVSLRTHPRMLESYLNPKDNDLRKGIWKYSTTKGREKCNEAFTRIIYSFLQEGNSPKLYSISGDGSSPLMKLAMLGVCGPPGSKERPLLVINPAYTNYLSIAEEIGRGIVSVTRFLKDDGIFTDVSVKEVEEAILKEKPGALLIIPYDNPSGQFMRQEVINEYARLCMRHDIFLISDEAYRGLQYTGNQNSSVWRITEKEVPGIEKAMIRISLETMSKVFNACGLRMGALVTDNKEFHEKAVAANTTYLCASVLDQHLVEALSEESAGDILKWVSGLRDHYKKIMEDLHAGFKGLMPGLIVSRPEASIYMVVDVRGIAKPGFDAGGFVKYCASKGHADIEGKKTTLLVSPMAGFYHAKEGNPGRTQMRIAMVEPEDRMRLVPRLFKELFTQFEAQR